MTLSDALGIFAFSCFLVAIAAYVKERRAVYWPLTEARVVKKEPQSVFERTGGMYVLNHDADYFLVWTVDGKDYSIKLEDEAYVVFAGFKLWRRAPSAKALELHYNPAKPLKYMLTEEFGTWKAFLVMSAVAFVGMVVANGARPF